jgi:hypothetical protein
MAPGGAPTGRWYFFTWRCLVCQGVAEKLLLDDPKLELTSHTVAVVEREGSPICQPHLRTEDRPWPYMFTDAEIDELRRELYGVN